MKGRRERTTPKGKFSQLNKSITETTKKKSERGKKLKPKRAAATQKHLGDVNFCQGRTISPPNKDPTQEGAIPTRIGGARGNLSANSPAPKKKKKKHEKRKDHHPQLEREFFDKTSYRRTFAYGLQGIQHIKFAIGYLNRNSTSIPNTPFGANGGRIETRAGVTHEGENRRQTPHKKKKGGKKVGWRAQLIKKEKPPKHKVRNPETENGSNAGERTLVCLACRQAPYLTSPRLGCQELGGRRSWPKTTLYAGD